MPRGFRGRVKNALMFHHGAHGDNFTENTVRRKRVVIHLHGYTHDANSLFYSVPSVILRELRGETSISRCDGTPALFCYSYPAMAHPITAPRRSPWLWVPTTYFAEGVPYVIVNTVSVVIYKKMGISNSLIALSTSFLYLPWVIKMLWGPLVDTRATKRRWIVGTQVALAAGFALASLALWSPFFFALSIAVFALIAFASATHDIAVDGFYMLGLTLPEQALFAGVRSTFYRLAMLFASGGLVVLAGHIEALTGDVPLSWIAALGAAGAVFAALAVFHAWYLPRPASDGAPRGGTEGGAPFLSVFRSYFTQPRIAAVLAFILLYRLGEAMLVKMAQPFLLDPASRGGLGLSTENVGIIYGTVGTASLLAGGILGGLLIARSASGAASGRWRSP
jgi:MFS transporter, PAT family, beta-lactamase induction signal transducer AmpG